MSVVTQVPRSRKGQIQVIFGPMFSGKTTELMRRIKRYQIAKHRCLIIKYANDTRYEKENLSTHDHMVSSAVSATRLGDIEKEAENYDVVAVDEGQFFPDTVGFAERLANKGLTIIVAALDATYQREQFGDILKLVPLAESVIKLSAVCMHCCGDASYTKRKGQETELEVIGGADKYMAVCRRCYFSPQKTESCPSPEKCRPNNILQLSNINKNLFNC